ncbi:hypothetical protein ABFS83_04G080800 [Erythranthe nasuta]
MGKRKGRKENEEEAIHENGEEVEEGDDGKSAGFFACYLLTSVCPRFKGHTYIGFTVNPRRRIRQHNGEIGSGAWRTKKKRPWEMVLCIHGFPTNVAALQFEWAWQHPVESLAVRKAAVNFKSLSGIANKIKLAYTMLTLPPWQSLNLTVNLFSTKYQTHTSGCPALPEQMRTKISPMDDLPCYNIANDCPIENDDDDGGCEGLSHESTEEESSRKNDDFHYYSNEEYIHRETQSSGCCSGKTQAEVWPKNSPPVTESTDEESSTKNDGFPNCVGSKEEYINRETESSGCCAAKTRAENWPKNSPPITEEEDKGQFFIVNNNDSPARSLDNSSYIAGNARKNHRLVEFITEVDEPREKESAAAATRLVATEKDEVEIIDIITPLPCKKKRRPASSFFPDVIDLTNSPMYV